MKTLLFSVLICFVKVNATETPVVEIAQGKLRGVLTDGHYQYLGIPFASLNKWFQAPGEPPKWSDIFEANDSLKSCYQYTPIINYAFGREDCLIINVYTPPDINTNSALPIMVFIHGGGYDIGGSSTFIYEPAPLVAQNVVVVTFNYRLGVYGFLCLGIKDAPGNAAMKDQVAALRWVKQNIKAFGGNPDSVTVFGESAGAASVHYLMLSPMGNGLFHRAILQSGSALFTTSFSYNPIEKASFLASKLGYNTTDPGKLLKIFQDENPYDVVKAAYSRDFSEKFLFAPCAENIFSDIEPFLTKSPEKIASSGIRNTVPTIIGYNNKESLFFVRMEDIGFWKRYYDKLDELLSEYLVFSSTEEQNKVCNDIKQFYFHGKPFSENNLSGLINFVTDFFFHYPIYQSIILLLRTSKEPVYNYYFKYDSPMNIAKYLSKVQPQEGAAHADELFYLFQPSFRFWPLRGNDNIMMKRMTQLWTNFAKSGNPTPAPSDLLPTIWEPSSNATALNFYNLDNDVFMRTLPNPERIKFWSDLYENYRIKPKTRDYNVHTKLNIV